jgi:HSP20 family protein
MLPSIYRTKNNLLNDDFFSGFFDTFLSPTHVEKSIPFDVVEKDSEYKIIFMLPGFDRGDINIEMNDRQLTISGERKSSEEESFLKKSTFYGRFEKSFTLPMGLKNSVDAELKNGLLYITLKKSDEKKKKLIEIK